MPVNHKNMGYSNHTLEKEDDFYYLIKLVAQKVRGMESIKGIPFQFTLIDAFAGCGYNYELNCPGSPVVGIQVLNNVGLLRHRHLLIDSNHKNTTELKQLFGKNKYTTILTSDCRDILKSISKTIVGWGVLVVDPNGDPFFNDLSAFYKEPNTGKIDVIVRISATNYKRIVAVHKRPDLCDSLENINKQFWYVKAPSQGPHKWTTLFGTNEPKLKPAVSKGYFKIDSPKGQSIVGLLNHTKATQATDYKPAQLPLDPFGVMA